MNGNGMRHREDDPRTVGLIFYSEEPPEQEVVEAGPDVVRVKFRDGTVVARTFPQLHLEPEDLEWVEVVW